MDKTETFFWHPSFIFGLSTASDPYHKRVLQLIGNQSECFIISVSIHIQQKFNNSIFIWQCVLVLGTATITWKNRANIIDVNGTDIISTHGELSNCHTITPIKTNKCKLYKKYLYAKKDIGNSFQMYIHSTSITLPSAKAMLLINNVIYVFNLCFGQILFSTDVKYLVSMCICVGIPNNGIDNTRGHFYWWLIKYFRFRWVEPNWSKTRYVSVVMTHWK